MSKAKRGLTVPRFSDILIMIYEWLDPCLEEVVSVTPMRRQYLQIKKGHPDAILMFRLGDFYEAFDEDAETVARVCNIVLTSRPIGKGQRVPLAGVPHHAIENYIAKLIQAGHKVAICDQVGDGPVKGLMPRDVIRVITPGTLIEVGLLDERRNNYLVALATDPENAGIAYVDITTGEFAATQICGPDISLAVQEELERLNPAELLLAEEEGGFSSLKHIPYPITFYDAWRFEYGNARNALLEHFGVASLAAYGCEDSPLAIRAAGAIIEYLRKTQKSALSQLVSLSTYSTANYMSLDVATRRNLELLETIADRSVKGSLLGVLDATMTPMGGRLLRRWISQPLLEIEPLKERLSAVKVLYDDISRRTELRNVLKKVRDLERVANRVLQRIVRPRELRALQVALEAVPQICEAVVALGDSNSSLDTASETRARPYPLSSDAWDVCREVTDFIERTIVPEPAARATEGGVIAQGFSPELDEIVAAAHEAKQWVVDLEQREQKRTGIKSLRVRYNKVFGYYIEVSKSNLGRVPANYIRKQTLVSAERYILPELKERESLILSAQDRAAELEGRIYQEVCDEIARYAARILDDARAMAYLDVYASLADVAQRNRYVCPVLTQENSTDIVGGRHPVVELMLDDPFVPNDTHLDDDELILIITGPNMSGKSTYLRQVALIALMAQIGSFVPAERATIGLVDRIFTRVGAQDQIAAGQSTFMVEMIETANILNHATSRSLLILDEIGRGTSTYDGISIAWAVAEYIHSHSTLHAKTLFATHYHELTELEKILPGVRNYNVAVVEEGDRVVFLHKIVPGGADRSYGIHVARLAGIPPTVIVRAQEMLEKLEGDNHRVSLEPRDAEKGHQLSLFSTASPVLEELKGLDVMAMSPLDALNTLYELQQKAQR